MKVVLASLMTLLVSLLLHPSDVRCERHARRYDVEYKIKHYRKRDTQIEDYFKGSNMKRVCAICHHKYDINLENCISDKREARYKCMLIAKDNPKFFEARMNGKTLKHDNDQHGKRSASLATYFVGENLKQACALCQKEFKIDEADCINDRGKAKLNCMKEVKKDKMLYEADLNTATDPPPDAAAMSLMRPTVPKVEDYFTKENLPKICKICATLKVNSAECMAGENKARKLCRKKVADVPHTIEEEWENMPRNKYKVRRITKRSAEFKEEDYFKGQNLPKVCEICEKYYGINTTDCIKNRQMVTDECRKKVEENPRLFEYKWTKSNSPALGHHTEDFGTTEDVQKICSFCDEQFNFSFSDCVADKNDIRQKCKKWILTFQKVTRNMLNKRSDVPEANGRDSLAFSNVKEKQEIKWKGF